MPVPDGVTTEVVPVAFPGRRAGPSKCSQIGASGLLVSWADLSQITCVHTTSPGFECSGTSTRCPCRMAWRCQSGPNSRTLTSARRSSSIPRWESGLMVGVRDTLLTSVHLPPLSTDKFAGISALAMRFKAFHHPPHQLHFHGRRVPHVAPHPFAFMTDSAEHGWMCLAITNPLAHGSALKPGTPAEICVAQICREGARVKENQLFRDLNIVVLHQRIKVIAKVMAKFDENQLWP